METPLRSDVPKLVDCNSLVHKIYAESSNGLHFAAPNSNLRANEADVVWGVLQMLQGFSSSLFKWDSKGKCFCAKAGIYVAHLSRRSLHTILSQFQYASTCLQLVDILVNDVKTSSRLLSPTLKAFACSVSSWIQRLRDVALKEEVKMSNSNGQTAPTLLGLANSLSSLCSGAEYLLDIVYGAIPPLYLEPYSPVPASEMAIHVVDYLYKRLDEACLVPGGEEEAYQMLLHLFIGSVLPYIQGLDSWLYEGLLDDPFEEMFFYANNTISVEDPEFWEKSYLLRRVQQRKADPQQSILTSAREQVSLIDDRKGTGGSSFIALNRKEWIDGDNVVYPLFIKDTAKSIVSAGKSLQLIRHVSPASTVVSPRKNNCKDEDFGGPVIVNGTKTIHHGQNISGLTLSETFCISVAGLIGHGDHISRHLWPEDFEYNILSSSESCADKMKVRKGDKEALPVAFCLEKIWYKLLTETVSQKRASNCLDVVGNLSSQILDGTPLSRSFCSENPVITVCKAFLKKDTKTWQSLNISRNFCLPPLNDEATWKVIFEKESEPVSVPGSTDFAFGSQFGEFGYDRAQEDTKMLEALFPFPTILPSFQEDLHVSGLLPFQNNSTLPSKVLAWIQDVEPGTTPLPLAIMQECLIVYIKRQVDFIGKQILSKLMHDWRLMDELAVLRAIYLLGSGDLLQHFLTTIFDKLDRRETWDDDFDLNSILQESIRNSADGNVLNAPDSLVVSITNSQGLNVDEQHNTNTLASSQKNWSQRFGINGLDSLNFTYKVSWPLELIANTEAIKKYNQIMRFLLKVKRAKFVLDKARRWMWKGKKTAMYSRKHHWLVEQKLLHFVDAFHQYVMDRVYHSAWHELCEGMAAARSLDEVMEVHEAYLLSIQRQCFVVPDKLWALIASRINSVLGLALEFYSIQQTLSSGGAVSTIKARCEVEVERIEKQFDECIAFLLRVLSFKLNVRQFPHLADLVTRINYNYFYMSDSGNLKATTAETVSSRLGKAFS